MKRIKAKTYKYPCKGCVVTVCCTKICRPFMEHYNTTLLEANDALSIKLLHNDEMSDALHQEFKRYIKYLLRRKRTIERKRYGF